MLQWAYTEDQGLIEVDLSAISAPFDSNQVMLGPWAKLFFQRMYGPTPFPLVSKALSPFPHILPFSSFPLAVPEIYHLYQPRFNSWVGKVLGEGNGYPLQYCCLENSMDRVAWQVTVHDGVEKSQTQLSDHQFHFSTAREALSWALWVILATSQIWEDGYENP